MVILLFPLSQSTVQFNLFDSIQYSKFYLFSFFSIDLIRYITIPFDSIRFEFSINTIRYDLIIFCNQYIIFCYHTHHGLCLILSLLSLFKALPSCLLSSTPILRFNFVNVVPRTSFIASFVFDHGNAIASANLACPSLLSRTVMQVVVSLHYEHWFNLVLSCSNRSFRFFPFEVLSLSFPTGLLLLPPT